MPSAPIGPPNSKCVVRAGVGAVRAEDFFAEDDRDGAFDEDERFGVALLEGDLAAALARLVGVRRVFTAIVIGFYCRWSARARRRLALDKIICYVVSRKIIRVFTNLPLLAR